MFSGDTGATLTSAFVWPHGASRRVSFVAPEALQRVLQVATRLVLVLLSKAGSAVQVRPAQEVRKVLGSRGSKYCVRNPPVFAPHLLFILLEPRGLRAEDGQVYVDQNLGVDIGRLGGMASEHDEIVNPLRALGPDPQFPPGGGRPRGPSLPLFV